MRYSEFRIIFENKAQYQAMLNSMVKNGIIDNNEANRIVQMARQYLKRNDRVVWFLRWYRLSRTYQDVAFILKNRLHRDRRDEFKAIFQRINKTDYDTVQPADTIYFLNRWNQQHNLEHVEYQLSLPGVDEVTWSVDTMPQQMWDRLEELEEEYNRRQTQQVDVEEGDEIVLDYGRYAWVKLNRGACDAEGRAMGHCGNVPSVSEGDRILSFRSKVLDGKQKPHLTFILDRKGYLGEMKGRANEKPQEKYHSYIVDLLKQDFIRGIRGGGYAPENNFELSDLDDDIREQLIQVKPSLGQLADLYGKDVDRSLVIDKLLSLLEDQYIYYSSGDERIYAIEFDDVEEIGSFMVDRTLKNVGSLDIFDGGEQSFDVYFNELTESMVEEILKKLDPQIRSSLIQYLKSNKGWDPDEYDLAEFIYESDNEIRDVFRDGAWNGVLVGTEKEIYDAVMSHLESYGIERIRDLTNINSELKQRLKYPNRTQWIWSISVDDVLQYVHYAEIDDDYLTDFFKESDLVRDLTDYSRLHEPNYGWDGWDADAAAESTAYDLTSIIDS